MNLRALRPPAWLVPLLPGTSRHFGPPRRMRSAREIPGLARDLGPAAHPIFKAPRLLNRVDPYWQTPAMPEPVRPFVVERVRARIMSPGG